MHFGNQSGNVRCREFDIDGNVRCREFDTDGNDADYELLSRHSSMACCISSSQLILLCSSKRMV